MKNMPGQTSQRTNWFCENFKVLWCVLLWKWNAIVAIDIFYSGYRYFQKKKEEYSYDWCPNPLYFNILLLIIYLSAILKHLFVIQKLTFIGSFGFAQNTLHDFQYIVLNS